MFIYIYIYKDNKNWIKMINYVDDALYYANNDNVRQNFEKKLSKRFHLSLLGKAKWFFVPSKKDSIITEEQIKEIKSRFGNLNYRSVIGALLYVSCCTRPDITYAVNKLAKFSHNPGIIHFRALIH